MFQYFKITKVKDASYTIVSSSTYEIPFEIVNNRIVIPVVIQGRTYNFLFDTGASLVIDSELLNELEYENIAKIKVRDANERVESLKYVKLSEIKCFDTSFKDQGAIVMNLSDPVKNSCINISGVFGASVMKDLIWQVNIESQIIRISNDIEKLDIDYDNLKIPFDKNPSQSPIIEVNLDGHREKLIIDTGSESNFSFPKTNIDFLSLEKSLTAFARFGGVFGVLIDTVYYLPKEIKFNSFKNESWQGVIEVRNGLKEGVVGLGFLKDYIFTIDWINQYVYLKKINHNKSSLSIYGFDFGKSGQDLIVTEVYKNLQAYEAGIRVGDIIMEIDDFSFKNATVESICNFIEKDYLEVKDSAIRIKVTNMKNYISLEKKIFFK
ncbi:retropepsin-like aspartic protease [Marivirga sp.]|uniref:retropepsin-like aspartic protease n=1 Tax=Marivirga sp. TaxID=2018662 RepID=UPI002D81005D|nr:aspartyl protease family protein [Marivirga sp.]HET8860484.1 aspartyl protease family protein [Marivirga sp.]